MMPVNVKPACAALLLLLALSLMGCASKPPMLPVALPTLPPPPSLTTPLPPVSYSLTAADAIKSWRQSLMGTPLMREPSLKPGQ